MRVIKYLCFTILIFTSLSKISFAASILEISFTQLVNKSESTFEGEVVAITPEVSANGNIYTFVDFLVLDVLSGNLNIGESITLRFTGGTVDGLTLNVGSVIPDIGEHGIYFIESNNAQLINPLYGWSQGHYRIQANGQIIAGNHQVVTGADTSTDNPTINTQISTGIAKGIITLPQQKVNTPPLSPPISLDEFKSLIKDAKK